MKRNCLFLSIISIICVSGLTSCISSKSMRKDILDNTADLYYVTTTPAYTGEIKNDIHLNFIDYSNMDYYTTVKKKGWALVPLLLYNYDYHKFEARLGERSLTMNYREFLMDALLAECNASTCFNLIDNTDSIACDSAYILDIKITKNITKGKMTIRNHSIFTGYLDLLLSHEEVDDWILPPYAVINRNKMHPAITELSVKAILRKDKTKLIEKEYQIKRAYQFTRKGSFDTYFLNNSCLNAMAENLSLATKELVEEMSRELHLVILSLK